VKSVGHSLRNSTGFVIPKGTVLYWSTSTKLSGSVKLAADLAPGGQEEVVKPGQTNGYTCTAHFFAGPADFVVKSVAWTPTGAALVVENMNHWTDGLPAMAKVESYQCLSTPATSALVQVPAIARGASKLVTVALAKGNATYLIGTANHDGATIESNKTNNSAYSVEYGAQCLPK
jgi:hypothetical protein